MFLPFLFCLLARTSQHRGRTTGQRREEENGGGDLTFVEFHALSRRDRVRSMRLLEIYARKDALHAAERLECINRSMYNGEQSGGKGNGKREAVG